MQLEKVSQELQLLPPKRLGTMLAKARLASGYSLVEAVDALGHGWTPMELLEVETGRRPVMDTDLEVLTGLYGIHTTSLIPLRSRLAIDLEEGTISVGGQRRIFGRKADPDQELLSHYLAMVYAMRNLRPGTEVPLRAPDLEVLSEALRRDPEQITVDLTRMMVENAKQIEPRMQRFRDRLIIPTVGVVVAAIATGGVLLLVNDAAAGAAPMGALPPAFDVEIGDAVVQERLPDGTPGPVEIRD